MAIDEQHVALPKLYGAPAYARPPRPAEVAPKPFDPDDLPIAAFQTQDERVFVESLPARAYAPGGGVLLGEPPQERGHAPDRLNPRPFKLRALAGRFLARNA
jgi:hypothetical protein